MKEDAVDPNWEAKLNAKQDAIFREMFGVKKPEPDTLREGSKVCSPGNTLEGQELVALVKKWEEQAAKKNVGLSNTSGKRKLVRMEDALKEFLQKHRDEISQ